jgi:hypothetical protein
LKDGASVRNGPKVSFEVLMLDWDTVCVQIESDVHLFWEIFNFCIRIRLLSLPAISTPIVAISLFFTHKTYTKIKSPCRY